MVAPVIVFLVLVVVIYFIIKSSYDQKLREETFEFTKKLHAKEFELQTYKKVSQITPDELHHLKYKLEQSQSEVQNWIQKYNKLEGQLYTEKASSKKIKDAISQINDNVKNKKKNDLGSNSGGGSNDDSSNLAIMLVAAGMMSEDSSSSYQGSGGDSSGGGSSDSYESSSRASYYESSDSSSSYDSGSSYDSSSSCDSSSSSDSGSSCGGD